MRDGDMPRFIAPEAAANSSVSFHSTVFWTHSEPDFLALLRLYGITEQYDLDLLSAKFFRNLSLRDIVKEFNWISKDTVRRRINALEKLLKERGIEKELLL